MPAVEKVKDAPTRDEVVAKIHELETAITETKNEATSKLKIVAVISIAAIALIAFSSGRRRALRPKTVVSFTKIK